MGVETEIGADCRGWQRSPGGVGSVPGIRCRRRGGPGGFSGVQVGTRLWGACDVSRACLDGQRPTTKLKTAGEPYGQRITHCGPGQPICVLSRASSSLLVASALRCLAGLAQRRESGRPMRSAEWSVKHAVASTRFPRVAGWIRNETARALFAASGLDFTALKKATLSREFKPVALDARIDFAVTNAIRDIETRNVVARLEGSDPVVKDETVVYSAHWDHFGWDPKLPGTKHEQVCHGAIDNASGVAALLEVAQAFAALPTPPRRSILFVATTAEEAGLLGAAYYVEHPLVPLQRTLANINFDNMNVFGRTRDLEIVGYGTSDLEDRLEAAARTQGRVIRPDQYPEKGYFYRADQFEFAEGGCSRALHEARKRLPRKARRLRAAGPSRSASIAPLQEARSPEPRSAPATRIVCAMRHFPAS
jgi:Peptidase family M28